ncbi:MAG: twin-arginine translocase TatA/TatE family subunit [Thermomicrobiales bacterium]
MPVGPLELGIILVIIIIIFGVGKLPQIGGALGQGIREFRESSRNEDGEEHKDDKPAQLESKVSANEPAKEEL